MLREPGRKAEAAEICLDTCAKKSLDEYQRDEGGSGGVVEAPSFRPEADPVGEAVPEVLPKKSEPTLEGSVVQTCPGGQCAQDPRGGILRGGNPSSPPG